MTDPHLLDRLDELETNLAFCREAMRHATIDLTMVLPLVDGDMQAEIRRTLDRIDEARERQ